MEKFIESAGSGRESLYGLTLEEAFDVARKTFSTGKALGITGCMRDQLAGAVIPGHCFYPCKNNGKNNF